MTQVTEDIEKGLEPHLNPLLQRFDATKGKGYREVTLIVEINQKEENQNLGDWKWDALLFPNNAKFIDARVTDVHKAIDHGMQVEVAQPNCPHCNDRGYLLGQVTNAEEIKRLKAYFAYSSDNFFVPRNCDRCELGKTLSGASVHEHCNNDHSRDACAKAGLPHRFKLWCYPEEGAALAQHCSVPNIKTNGMVLVQGTDDGYTPEPWNAEQVRGNLTEKKTVAPTARTNRTLRGRAAR